MLSLIEKVVSILSPIEDVASIEAIVFHPSFLAEHKQRLADIGTHQLKSSSFWIKQMSHPITLSPEILKKSYKVNKNSAIIVLGMKYLSGDGWGRYQISREGTKTAIFTRSEEKLEDGVIIGALYFYPDEVINITQISGEGTINFEVLGLMLKPDELDIPVEVLS